MRPEEDQSKEGGKSGEQVGIWFSETAAKGKDGKRRYRLEGTGVHGR